MKKIISSLAAMVILSTGSAASAQDSMAGHDMSAMNTESILPDICTANASDSAGMGSMEMGGMDEAHTALMAGMDAMNRDMMTGAMAEDIDVAFVCGMIPHHQGAIAMARAELQYGDNDWAKEMAEKVIAAQEQEIMEMLAWLAEQAQ